MYAKTKRFLAMVLTLCMVMGFLPMGAAAAPGDITLVSKAGTTQIRSLMHKWPTGGGYANAAAVASPAGAWSAIQIAPQAVALGVEWVWTQGDTGRYPNQNGLANDKTPFYLGDIVEIKETITLTNTANGGSVFVGGDNAYLIFFNGHYIAQSPTLNGTVTTPFIVNADGKTSSSGDYAAAVSYLMNGVNSNAKFLQESFVTTTHEGWKNNAVHVIPKDLFLPAGQTNDLRIIVLNEYMGTGDGHASPASGPDSNPGGVKYFFTTQDLPSLQVEKYIDQKPFYEHATDNPAANGQGA